MSQLTQKFVGETPGVDFVERVAPRRTRAAIMASIITIPARLVAVALLVGLFACAPGDDTSLVLFAAASTSDAVDAVLREFTRSSSIPVRASYAASSSLARQIEAGARFDLFISAHPDWMDRLVRSGHIDEARRIDLLHNRLVIVRPATDESARSRPDPPAYDADRAAGFRSRGRVAIGDPAHVPAGVYAESALRAQHVWNEVANRLVATPDVRAALRLVELGEADWGVVYATDARASTRVEVVMTLPLPAGESIDYPCAPSTNAGSDVDRLLDYLRSDAARDIFERYGFIGAPSATRGDRGGSR